MIRLPTQARLSPITAGMPIEVTLVRLFIYFEIYEELGYEYSLTLPSNFKIENIK